jgi:hypothetical protein
MDDSSVTHTRDSRRTRADEHDLHTQEQRRNPTDPLSKTPYYGATECSNDPTTAIPTTRLVSHSRQRRRNEGISSSTQEHEFSRPAFLFYCLFTFSCWMRELLFMMWSIPKDDDLDEGGSSIDEGESSHDRMTATTSSISATQLRLSSRWDTISHTAASSHRSTHTRSTQDRPEYNFRTDDRSLVDRLLNSSSSSTRWKPKHDMIFNKHGRRILARMVWLLILAGAYSMERCTFKILLDRMGPFRLVVGTQVVLGLYILILLLWILFVLCSTGGKNLILQILGKKRSNTISIIDYLGRYFGVSPTNKIVLLPLADLGSAFFYLWIHPVWF